MKQAQIKIQIVLLKYQNKLRRNKSSQGATNKEERSSCFAQKRIYYLTGNQMNRPKNQMKTRKIMVGPNFGLAWLGTRRGQLNHLTYDVQNPPLMARLFGHIDSPDVVFPLSWSWRQNATSHDVSRVWSHDSHPVTVTWDDGQTDQSRLTNIRDQYLLCGTAIGWKSTGLKFWYPHSPPWEMNVNICQVIKLPPPNEGGSGPKHYQKNKSAQESSTNIFHKWQNQ